MSKNGIMSESGEIKSQIKQAIIKLMKNKRLEKISVGEIVQEAHVSRSSFYRYYDSVDDVIREEENRILDSILKIHRLSLSERLIDARTESFQSTLARSEVLSECAEFLAAITGPNGDPQFEYKAKKIMREYFRKKLDYSEDSAHDNLIIEYLTCGWYYSMNSWFMDYPELPPEKFVDYMYEACEVLNVFLGMDKIKK